MLDFSCAPPGIFHGFVGLCGPWLRTTAAAVVVVVVVVYFVLSRLLYLAFSANLGLLCMPHPGMGPLV